MSSQLFSQFKRFEIVMKGGVEKKGNWSQRRSAAGAFALAVFWFETGVGVLACLFYK